MTGNLSLIVVATIANLGLGATVLSRGPKNKIHRYFALFSVSVATWTLSNGLVSADPDSASGYLWGRLAFASASVIPVAFLLFASVFPTASLAPARGILTAFVAIGIIAFLLSFTHLIVRGTSSANGSLRVIYGPLHLPFGIYFVCCLGFSLFLLARRLVALRGLQALQVRYLFAGVLTAAVGATITNLVIPLLFHTSKFSRYGPLFGILMIATTAHSIIRHRLMNIRLVVRRGFSYLLAVAMVGAVFVSAVGTVASFTGRRPEDVPLTVQVVVALLIALAFQPLRQRIQVSLDHYLYRESYDYKRIIQQASRTIGSLLELKPLLQYICRITSQTLRPDSVTVFTRNRLQDTFESAARVSFLDGDTASERTTVGSIAPLPTFLMKSRQPLLRDDLGRMAFGKAAEEAVAQLSDLGGDFAFPMLSESQLIGFIVVGPKLSGDAYFTDDLELLSTLANQAAIAIQNAQLYRQVLLANEYIENILRTMDSGVITIEAGGKVAVANATAERLVGTPRPALISSTLNELPHPLASQLQATLLDGQSRLQVESILAGDVQRPTPIVCSTSALRDMQGSILGAVAVFSDLSKLKALESEKRRAERLASFGALASGIAHEIKNPLVAIKTFAELLPERFGEQDFREDFSKVVITEIERIDGLVSRLRGIAAPAPQSVGVIDIYEPISETLLILRAQLEQTRTVVRRQFEDARPYIAVDAGQLKQLFLNLLINAVEAMGMGGELTIRVSRREAHNVSWVVAAVSDTGPGIPDSMRAHVFEPFFTTKARGSGLGLAICRGITDAHRGTIRAEGNGSRPGTTIVVEFPAVRYTPQLAEQDALLG